MELIKINKKNILENVKVENEMFSLTDLWRLSGSPKNQNPNDWIRTDSAIELIETVASILNTVSNRIIKSKRGKGGGTFSHKNIALAYAKYLDPKLHILVNEVFFERVEEEKNPDLIIDRYKKSYRKKGHSEAWIVKRLQSLNTRNHFTSALARHGVQYDGFKNCTNAIYEPLFGGSSAVVRERKGLVAKSNIRDNVSALELHAIMMAEMLATDDIETNKRKGNAQCEISARRAAASVSKSIIEFRRESQKRSS